MKNMVEYNINIETGKRTSSFRPFMKTFLSKYKRKRFLSSGGHSKVYIVTKIDTGKEFICKTLVTKRFEEHEYNIPNSIDNSCVVKILEIYERYEKSVCFTHLIMEYRPNGVELFDYVIRNKVSTEEKLRNIIKEVINCVTVLHDNYICHGDLKFENFIVTEEFPLKIMVIDFGFSFRVEPDCSVDFYGGTDQYVAPEVLKDRKGSLAADIWSIGIMAYYVMSVKKNITEDTDFELDYKRLRLSPELCEFLRMCLQVDDMKRSTIYKLKDSVWLNQKAPENRLYEMLTLKKTR